MMKRASKAVSDHAKQMHWQRFQKAHPEVAAWIDQSKFSSIRARVLKGTVYKNGEITAKELDSAKLSMINSAKHLLREPNAILPIQRFRRELDFLAQKGCKRPTINFAELQLSRPDPRSVNKGFVYIHDGDTYIGKVSPTGELFRHANSSRGMISKVIKAFGGVIKQRAANEPTEAVVATTTAGALTLEASNSSDSQNSALKKFQERFNERLADQKMSPTEFADKFGFDTATVEGLCAGVMPNADINWCEKVATAADLQLWKMLQPIRASGRKNGETLVDPSSAAKSPLQSRGPYRRETALVSSQEDKGFAVSCGKKDTPEHARYVDEPLGSRDDFIKSNKILSEEIRRRH